MERNLQAKRLEELLARFKADSGRCRDWDVPREETAMRQALRALMNVRMPGEMDADTLRLQDEYLTRRAREKGVVTLADILTAAAQYGAAAPFGEKLSVWQGDITRLALDAIVNAANSQMLGCFVPLHSCIDNCIHTFAGVQLRAECARRMDALRARYGEDYEQPTAVPMLTGGYNLPAKRVIHVVGPIVEDGLTPALERDLADCYRNALDLCLENGLRSVAFCCISTGVFRFPPDRAAEIAVAAVVAWLRRHPDAMDRIVFNVFRDEDRALYERILSSGAPGAEARGMNSYDQ